MKVKTQFSLEENTAFHRLLKYFTTLYCFFCSDLAKIVCLMKNRFCAEKASHSISNSLDKFPLFFFEEEISTLFTAVIQLVGIIGQKWYKNTLKRNMYT